MRHKKEENHQTQDLPLLTVDEAARRLSVSSITVRRMITDHQIKAVRIRGAIRISPRALDEWVESQQLADGAA